MNRLILATALASLCTLAETSPAAAQAFDLWPDPELPPPGDQIAFLPPASDEEGGDPYVHLGDQTLERTVCPTNRFS